MATNKSSPHLQIRHNLSDLLLDDWKWLHPIAITVSTLCLVELCIQWCGALRWNCKLIFWKSYQSWLPSKFYKAHISVVGNRVPQPQDFITLLLDPHWTYFCKHCIYYKNTPNLVLYLTGDHRHQAIAWANVDPDPCHQLASLGQN